MKFDERYLLKSKLLTDLYFFTRYFYNKQTNQKFVRGDHFKELSDVLEKVYTHEITRLIINIPPRFGKTEIAVINFIAKGLMINPKAKFIHTSYSDSLALENSNKIRDLVKSEAFQELCPIKIKSDTDSKAKWYTEDGGGVYATSSGGAITGFGAGIVGYEDFGGAIIIDDPLKPTDANSTQVRTAINDRFDNTIISRCNNSNTPIIVIMQRLHEEDLSGVLLKREGWYHINMPAIKQDGSYLWDYRAETVEDVKKNSKYVYLTQYQQDPTDKEISNKFIYMNEQIEINNNEYKVSTQHELHLSFDFNHSPMTCSLSQPRSDLKKYITFDTVLADINTFKGLTPIQAICKLIDEKYTMVNKILWRVTGDSSGLMQQANQVKGFNFFKDIQRLLKLNESQFNVIHNINHPLSRNIINDTMAIFCKTLEITGNTSLLQNDIKNAFADEKGTLNEWKKISGGHFLDNYRYKIHSLLLNLKHKEYKIDIKTAYYKITGIRI